MDIAVKDDNKHNNRTLFIINTTGMSMASVRLGFPEAKHAQRFEWNSTANDM